MPVQVGPSPRAQIRSAIHFWRVAAIAALLVALASLPAYAISIRDIIALHRAQVSDDILVALLDADPTLFSLDAAQILELKKAGVSDRVVVAMLRSGREPRASTQAAASPPPEPAVPATPAATYAAPPPPVEQAPVPGYVVVGQSPELPSAQPPLVFVAPTPWVATVVGVPSGRAQGAATPYHGFGRFINNGFAGSQPGRFINDGFVDPATQSAAPVVTFSAPPVVSFATQPTASAPPPAHHGGHHRK